MGAVELNPRHGQFLSVGLIDLFEFFIYSLLDSVSERDVMNWNLNNWSNLFCFIPLSLPLAALIYKF